MAESVECPILYADSLISRRSICCEVMTEGHSHFSTILLESVTPLSTLSSWFSWAAIRTLFALSISARREAQWSKPRQARGEERRRGERTSGGTEKEGGGGRTKGKDEGCSLILLCPMFSGRFQSRRGWREGEAETGIRKIKNGRKERRDSKEDGVQWWAEWSQLCRMRCWWEKSPVSVFPDQF